ncbi:hypothetical protein C461_14313 [Halorubrum aidingense JCM 13560]|uniref:HTH iclR-type domain-containing protein n=1 Tax=Halorubrum aidingense JCM 13560 TaxID=1230454 RepID=M0P549_9EURY|nr:hypothetical protein [Halorubrum aidingense]EMA65277.1 hypothetical protein C461_14313 [Halorubrum aidingense JCM 13560]
MRRRDRTVGSIAALLVAVCCVAAVAFAAPAGAQAGTFLQTADQPEPDNTITRITLADDGTATWEITLRTRLENETDVDEYERFQGRFRSNTSRYLDPFADRMTGVVAAANESSERSMRASEFDADTSIQEVPRRWGVVSFRFTWTGFAAVDGDAVVVGDVFDGGFFIGDGDVLAIVAPDGYALSAVEPSPDDIDGGTVEWRGREDFADRRPSVRAEPTAAVDGDESAGDDTDGDSAGGVGDRLGIGAVVALLLVGVIAFVLYVVRSGRLQLGSENDGTAPNGVTVPANDPETEAPTTSESMDDLQNHTDSVGLDESGDGSVGGVDPELLTDEDRVRHALEEAGGRMKQSNVVEALGWSKSKTSRVLSGMADDGEIEKLRIGRENVIDLTGDTDD